MASRSTAKDVEAPRSTLKRKNSFVDKSKAEPEIKLSQDPSIIDPRTRVRNFNRLVKDHKKNNFDRQIPGYNPNNSISYIFEFQAFNDLRIHDILRDDPDINNQEVKFRVEFYFTFLYKKKPIGDERAINFFFGRTTKTIAFDLHKDSSGNHGFKLNTPEYMFFHSSLNNQKENRVYIIVEAALIKFKPGSFKELYSSGYLEIKDPFQPMVNFDAATFIRGCPRDLLVTVDEEKSTARMPSLGYMIREMPHYDKLKLLIPQHCFVTKDSIVPGLDYRADGFANCTIPAPPSHKDKTGSSKDKDEKIRGFIPTQKPTKLYFHNIEIQSNPKFEQALIKLVTDKEIAEAIDSTGNRTITADETRARVSERKLVFYLHNTWNDIGEAKTHTLKKADRYGVYNSAGNVEFDNFIAQEFVAVVVEFQIVVANTNNLEMTYVIGYDTILPELNSIGAPKEMNVERKLIQGPGQSMRNQLVLDRELDKCNNLKFEFSIKCAVSTSQKAPRRTMSIENIDDVREPRDMRDSIRRPIRGDSFASGLSSQHSDLSSEGSDGEYTKLSKNRKKDKVSQKGSSGKELRQMRDLEKKLQQFQHDQAQMFKDLNQSRGSLGGTSQDQERMISLVKEQYRHETDRLKDIMKDMTDRLASIEGNIRQGYDDPDFRNRDRSGSRDGKRDQTPFAMDGLLNVQMGQIANVFYNIMNMVGTKNQDQRMIDMSHEIRNQIQTRKFKNLFSADVPFPGQKKLNLLRVFDLEQEELNRLKAHGLDDLMKHPANRILSHALRKEDIDMRIERRDPLTASTFEFKFVSYRPSNTPQLAKSRKFYFQMRFFIFEPIRTEDVEVFQNFGDEQGYDELKAGVNYFLKKQRPKNRGLSQADALNENIVQVVKNIDPSKSKQEHLNMKFAEYLKERFLTIDMFDSQTHFYFGTVKIPLFEMVRQGQQYVSRAKECEIFNDKLNMDMGTLTVMMSNLGKKPEVQDVDVIEPEFRAGNQPSQLKSKKIIVSNPMNYNDIQREKNAFQSKTQENFHSPDKRDFDVNSAILSQMTHQEIASIGENQHLRKKLRIDRIKKMAMMSNQNVLSDTVSAKTIVSDPKIPEWQKYSALQEIEIIRQTKKQQMLNEMSLGHVTDTVQIPMIPGEISFYTIKLERNNTEQDQDYTIFFEDPDDQYGVEEISMINSPDELDYWRRVGRIGNVGRGAEHLRGGHNSVRLGPGDSFEILVKFLTFRDCHREKASAEFIRPRVVRIEVRNNTTNTLFKAISCKLEPTYSPTDHVFRYFKPQNSYFEVRIPPFLQFGDGQFNVKCSKPSVICQIDRSTNEIIVRSKSGKVMDMNEFTVFLQEGNWATKTLAAIRIEVTAVECMYAQTQPGVQSSMALNLYTERVRNIQLFSSNPSMVTLPKESRRKNTFMMTPNMFNTLEVYTKTFSPSQEEVVINAVDKQTGELVKTWLLILASLNPIPTEVYQRVIEIPVEQTATEVVSYSFKNDSSQNLFFMFDSSDETVMKVEPAEITLKAKNKVTLQLSFEPSGKIGSESVFLFITDEDQVYLECIKFDVNYTGRGGRR